LRRGVAVLVGGTTIAQGIIVLTSPVLTRLYQPSEVGVYSVAVSILSILIIVSGLRYETAIPLPADDVEAANVLALSLLTIAGTSLACSLVLWVAGSSLLALFGASILGPFVLLLTVGQLGGGVVSALTFWAIRTKNFSAIAATRLTQSGTLSASQVGLGALRFGAPALVLGAVLGSVAGSSRLARAAWRSHGPVFRQVSRRGILAAANRYRRFPIFAAPSSLLNTVGLQAPLLLIVALYGTSVGGRYALADRICGLPVTLVAAAVGQVFFAETARLAREEPSAMLRLFWSTTRSLARTAIVPFVLLALAGPFLAGLVFGESWGEAGLFVAILAPMYFLQLVLSPTGCVLDVLERQDLTLLREILRLCLVSGAVLIAATAHLSAVQALCALSAALCVNYLLYGLITWRAMVTCRRSSAGTPPADPIGQDVSEWPGY
jgi:O-antigen/teichoic acid export membrane protein